jgi:hypothetical protein
MAGRHFLITDLYLIIFYLLQSFTMRASITYALALVGAVEASGLYRRVNASSPWYLERFSSLLTFGDSYTDENRLNYFGSHNGSAPPPGTYLPEVSSMANSQYKLTPIRA